MDTPIAEGISTGGGVLRSSSEEIQGFGILPRQRFGRPRPSVGVFPYGCHLVVRPLSERLLLVELRTAIGRNQASDHNSDTEDTRNTLERGDHANAGIYRRNESVSHTAHGDRTEMKY
jgi:hypothetical protein